MTICDRSARFLGGPLQVANGQATPDRNSVPITRAAADHDDVLLGPIFIVSATIVRLFNGAVAMRGIRVRDQFKWLLY